MTKPLTHLDESGAANMVDVAEKPVTERIAVAEGAVIMAAKRTHELIPLCHAIALSAITIDIEPDDALPGLLVRATAKVADRTGVEMEALTAVALACLTIYDMAKAVDRGMEVTAIRLVQKRGGRSGTWRRAP